MSDSNAPNGSAPTAPRKNLRRYSFREFFLVLFFLTALVWLVYLVLQMPAHLISGSYDTEASAMMGFKEEVLAIVLTAFGAWIGAGAAYFFGRENFREAVQGIQDARTQTVEEILRNLKIRNLTLRPKKYQAAVYTEAKRVEQRIKGNERDWFVILEDQTGAFIAAFHEEKIWRLIAYPEPVAASWSDLESQPIWKVLLAEARQIPIGEITSEEPEEQDLNLIKSVFDISETFSPDTSVYDAEEILEMKKKYLGIVLDDDGSARGYFTTGDIRDLLTRGIK